MDLKFILSDDDINKLIEIIYNKEKNELININNQCHAILKEISNINLKLNNIKVDDTNEEINDKCIIPTNSTFTTLKTSKELVNAMKAGWNLAGTLEAVGSSGLGTETSWGNPKATQKLFDTIKEKGFNAVRIPITWSQHIDWNSNDKTIDEAWMNRVKEVVQYALNDDLLVIINTHHDHSQYSQCVNFHQWLTLETSQKDSTISNFKKIWKQIATAFKDYDGRLIFEGWNEIQHNKQDWIEASSEEWNILNTLSQTFVDVVRETGSNNIYRCLMINPPMTSDKNMLEKMIIPKDKIDNKILVSGHPYDSRTDANDLEDKFANWDKMIEKGIPVIFGEVGTDASMKESERVMNAKNFSAVSRKHGITLFWWDDTTRLLLNRVTYEWEYESTVDAFISGSYTGEIQNKIYTASYDFNDLKYWKTACLDEKTGSIIAGKYNNKILNTPINVKENHQYNFVIKSHDNGFQIKNYVFYDKDGKYVYGIHKPNMYTFAVVCPPNAVTMNFTIWNPWGNRSDEQLTDYFNYKDDTYLTISVKEEETNDSFNDERMLVYNNLDLNNYNSWRKGEYKNYDGTYNDGNIARLCTKGLIPVDSDSYYKLEIIQGNKNYDISNLALTVCEYDKDCEYIMPLYRSYPPCAVYTGSSKNIGVTLFFRNNLNGATQDEFKTIFDNNVEIKITKINEASLTITKTSSDFTKSKQLSTSTGKSVDSGESYRLSTMFDVSNTGKTIVVYVGDDRLFVYAEYDEQFRLINCENTDRNNIFVLSNNAKYFRFSVHNVDSSSTFRIGYNGTINEVDFSDEDSIMVVDKSKLKSVIEKTKGLLNITKISENGLNVSVDDMWITQDEYDKLNNIYETANKNYVSITNEDKINLLIDKLNNGCAEFNSKVQRGKSSTSDFDYLKLDIACDGKNVIDTGIKLFDIDKDWSIEIVYDNKDVFKLGSYNYWSDNIPVILYASDKYGQNNINNGFYRNYYSGTQQCIMANTCTQYLYPSNPINNYNKLVEIYTHKAGSNSLRIIRRGYKTNPNGSLISVDMNCNKFDNTLLVGGEPNNSDKTTMPNGMIIHYIAVKYATYDDDKLKERFNVLWQQFGCEI